MHLTTNIFHKNKLIIFIYSWIFLLFTNSSIQAESFFNPGLERIQKGIQKYRNKDFYSAFEEFQKAEEIFPEDPRLDYNIGSALAGGGRFTESIPYFQKSLNGNDAKLHSKAYFNMGNAYANENQKKKAMDSYRKALENDPTNELARRNMELLLKPKRNQDQSQSDPPNNNPIANGGRDFPQNGNGSNGKPNQSKDNSKSSNSNSNSGSKSQGKNSLSPKEADRIMDSLSSDKIQRNKSKDIFQFQRDKFW